MDYWERSEGIKLKPKLASISDPDYPKYEHEQIADAKAFKHMAEVLGGALEMVDDERTTLTLPYPWVDILESTNK